jgi:ubiquinone/menaquinone biosynthesis C-methylase UbiE
VQWYVRETLLPRLDATCELLEVGSSRVGTRSLTSEAVTGPCRCTIVDLRTLDFHAAIEAPHRFMPMDVTKLAFADASFDVILCNNTLPYIRDDQRALGEIFRCLKSDGLAMLDSHYAGETTRSVAEYRLDHPQLSDGFFAENGDQWVYGRDYIARIEATGFKTRTDVLFEDRCSAFKRRHGLKERHALTVAFKSAQGEARFAPTGAIRAGERPGGMG